MGTATMTSNSINRNLFSSDNNDRAGDSDGDSVESITDTLSRIDTEIRLKEINKELERGGNPQEMSHAADEAVTGDGLLLTPQGGGTGANVRELMSSEATAPYDAVQGQTSTADREDHTKTKLLVEKLFLEQELKRRLLAKQQKRNNQQGHHPCWHLAKAWINAVQTPRVVVEPTTTKAALFHFTTRELNEEEYLPLRADDVAGKLNWTKQFEKFLNLNGHALSIFRTRKWKWAIDLTVDAFADYLIALGIDPAKSYSYNEMEQLHWHGCYENRELSTMNMNIWNSVLFLDAYLRKAASRNVLLTSKLNAIPLNSVLQTLTVIDDFYYQLDTMESIDFSLKLVTLKVENGQSIRTLDAMTKLAEVESTAYGHIPDMQHLKFVYVRGVKDIYGNSCYSRVKPLLEDHTKTNVDTVNAFEQFCRERGFDINKVYEGPPRENNKYAIELAARLSDINKIGFKTPVMSTKLGATSANFTNAFQKCTDPRCRKNRKFAAHLAKDCRRKD